MPRRKVAAARVTVTVTVPTQAAWDALYVAAHFDAVRYGRRLSPDGMSETFRYSAAADDVVALDVLSPLVRVPGMQVELDGVAPRWYAACEKWRRVSRDIDNKSRSI